MTKSQAVLSAGCVLG